MPLRVKLALAFYIALLNIGLIFSLVKIWPVANTEPLAVSAEARYLLCAAFAGALGAYIHLATSFIDYAGKSRLAMSWGWWYILRPWIGSSLALVVYFVIRAGFITGAGDAATTNMNPYGICAVSALSGMFSKQATEKLREVFENICSTDSKE